MKVVDIVAHVLCPPLEEPFAFSQGLESAFELGWVKDEASLGDWLTGVLDDGLTRC